jgi:hypothetical protein
MLGIGGAIGSFIEEVIVQFKGDTADLERAEARLAQSLEREERAQQKAMNSWKAIREKRVELERQYSQIEGQLSAARVRASEMAIMGVTKATDAEIAALMKSREAMAIKVQQEQTLERQAVQTARALELKVAALRADSAAMAATPRGGVSGVGAAAIGALGAIGGMVALQAVQALAQTVEHTATAYIKWGHEVEHTTKLLGSNAEQASVLLYTYQRFSLDTAMADRTILQLSRHVAENEDKFAKLGVQTRDTTGHFRNAYEIFDQVRHVLSQSGDSIEKNVAMMELLARSGAGGGTSFAELASVLSLTDEQMKALEDEATRLGFKLGDEAAKKAYALENQMRANAQAMKGFQLAASQWVAPAIGDLIAGLTRLIAVIQFASKSWGNLWDTITAFHGSDARARLDAFVDEAVADAKKIGEAIDAQGGPPPDVSNSAMNSARQAAADAIRERIAAIQEESRVQQEALREELSDFERTKQREIDLIQELQKTSQRAHEDEIAAIEDEKRAADEAFTQRQRQREDTITGLRAQLTALEEQWREEDARASLLAAEKQLGQDAGRTVFRTRGMTEEQYQEAVFKHNQQILADEKRVADEKKKIARDQEKFTIGEQIKALEAIATLERRALDDFKKGRDEQVRAIRYQMKVEKDLSDSLVKGLQDQIKVEKDRVEDKIKGIQKETREIVAALNEQLKAHEHAAAAATAAWNTAAAAARAAAEAATAAWIAGQDQAHRQGEHSSVSSATSGTYSNTGLPVPPWYSMPSLPTHDFPHTMTLPEPTALVGMSGRSYGIAAARGPEPISFGGTAEQQSESVQHIHLHMDGREITSVVVDRLGRAVGRRATFGFGRKP